MQLISGPGTQSSGSVEINTADSSLNHSGDMLISSGSATASSGNVRITSGCSQTGQAGDVALCVGQSSGGDAVGSIAMQGGHLYHNGCSASGACIICHGASSDGRGGTLEAKSGSGGLCCGGDVLITWWSCAGDVEVTTHHNVPPFCN